MFYVPRIRKKHSQNPSVIYKFLELKSQFNGIKQLWTCYVDFNNVKLASLDEVLSNFEYLHMFDCKMEENFIQNILTVAPNIKRLSLMSSCTGKRWLAHTYQTLEHCEIVSKEVMPIAMFLRLNPNIRKFGTNSTNLWENRHLLQTADIKLDDLAVYVNDKQQFCSYYQLLNELHQIDFFKRLKIHIFYD